MFGTLLKKQLTEIFRTWFYNPKTNKARDRAATIGLALLFAALMLGVFGVMFAALAVALCEPLGMAGMDWMYFALFGLLSVVLGMLGSVFSTYSGLYLAKDNDLLLSMPIPVWMIITTRLFSTYIVGTAYSACVFLPGVIVYQVIGGFDLPALIGGIVMMLQISLIVLTLSCLLGWAVAKISMKLTNRSYVKVLLALLFIGLYYFVYFRAQELLTDFLANAVIYGEKIRGSVYVLYYWGLNGTGSPLPLVICSAVFAAAAAAVWLLLSGTFIGIATSSPNEKKSVSAVREQKAKSVSSALLSRETARFTSSANYMLNCGLGILFLPAAGIALLVKGDVLIDALAAGLDSLIPAVPVIIAGLAFALSAMTDTAAPSVSLEGKSLWIAQSLPIHPWQALKAKIMLQFICSVIPTAVLCVCAVILMLNFGVIPLTDIALCVVLCLLNTALVSLFDMFIGVKMPILNWTNEIFPIKQAGGVTVAIFANWGYSMLIIFGYFVLRMLIGELGTAIYLGAFIAVGAVLSIILYRWLKTKGAEIFGKL